MYFNILKQLWRPDVLTDAFEYSVDAAQRSILFTDIMRKRGNEYIEHIKNGKPPVLVFDYEIIVDGRNLSRPVNYAIVQILDRRQPAAERHSSTQLSAEEVRPERRKEPAASPKSNEDLKTSRKRPIVVIDPRAGHGPGIGGSKLDSQIGVALNAGHPVYFVMFYPDPEPGQTLADVQTAEVKFLEEVIRRHPHAEPPAVIGNCQAGWAAALIGADRPDVTGPLVFNGSPLSYWGGVEGANPMRYAAGLCGGNWLTSLWCDLGNGIFDGAHLVFNFENLNPANTYWSKQYHVYANVDTEEERFLGFEKWWGGFFKMNREEIHFIVESLFVGNELENGLLELEEDKWINLKNFKDPIVVFASEGDNITPPQQALNWIYKVYGTVDEIKRNGQVIVFILHPKIGHLGIFVGSKVAKKEHTAIIGTVDMIEYLAPGLYEMVITEEAADNETKQHVRFEERTMDYILSLDDGLQDEEAFNSVAAVSRANDILYNTMVSPWVRMMTNEVTAEWIRQMHPLRIQRYTMADTNPFLWPSMLLAPWVKEYRSPVSDGNQFLSAEKTFSSLIESSLDDFRNLRDQMQERLFKYLYDNSMMKTLFPETRKAADNKTEQRYTYQEELEKELWHKKMILGGFEDAMVRVVLIVALADSSFDQRQFLAAQEIAQTNKKISYLKPAEMKIIVKEQAALIEHSIDQAIATLTMLLPLMEDRIEVLQIARDIAKADDNTLNPHERRLVDKIESVLEL